MSHKQCWIMITKKCNLRCSYCLMKNEELMATFKPATMEEILKKEYSAYCITGGEPFYNKKTTDLIVDLILAIRNKSAIPAIYLYSNGERKLNKIMAMVLSSIEGVNISPHGRNIPYKKIKIINMYCPVRLHRQDTKITPRMINFCEKENIEYKIWHKDDCTTVPEDRFILTDSY